MFNIVAYCRCVVCRRLQPRYFTEKVRRWIGLYKRKLHWRKRQFRLTHLSITVYWTRLHLHWNPRRPMMQWCICNVYVFYNVYVYYMDLLYYYTY